MLKRSAGHSLLAGAAVAAGVFFLTNPAGAPPPGPPPGGGGGGAPLERVVYISDNGVSEQDNGNALLDAIADINNGLGPCSNPGPSASTPCLIQLGPAVYDVGVTPVVMIPFVDIAGSGQDTTEITGFVEGDGGDGIVIGANNSELRLATVTNTGPGLNRSIAISTDGTSVSLSHVTAIAEGGINLDGILGSGGGEPHLFHVRTNRLRVSGGTELTAHQSIVEFPGLTGASVEASSILHADSSQFITNLRVGGETPNAGVAILESSQLDGAAVEDQDGVIKCVYVSDGDFAPHSCNLPNAVGGIQYVNEAFQSQNGTNAFVTASCSDGRKVLGGGFNKNTSSSCMRVNGSFPTVARDGWTATFTNSCGTAIFVDAYAVCAFFDSP